MTQFPSMKAWPTVGVTVSRQATKIAQPSQCSGSPLGKQTDYFPERRDRPDSNLQGVTGAYVQEAVPGLGEGLRVQAHLAAQLLVLLVQAAFCVL